MPKVPCKNPSVCRVTFHLDTTQPKCLESQKRADGRSGNLAGVPMKASGSSMNDAQISQLEAEIERRTTSPEFHMLLQRREEIAKHSEEIQQLISETADPLEKTRLKREAKELYIQKLQTRQMIEDYKDETATQYVYPLNQLTDGQIPEYEGDRLGDCVRTVSAPTGSREWLEQRQKGIGGSDVGAIIGTGGQWASRNFDQVWESKVEPISDEQVEEQSVENRGGAMGRGHTWEELTRRRFQQENPHLEVMVSKDSWMREGEDTAVVNVDGLLSDTGDGVPNGIWEGKTSSNADDWADGVPEGYKAQVLYYLEKTGFDFAYVSVMIDDHDYRQYRIDANDPVTTNSGTKPFREYLPELDSFWEKVKDHRFGLRPQGTVKRGRTSNPKSRFSKLNATAVNNLSAFRDESPEETERLIEKELAKGKTLHNAMTSLYKSFDPSTRKRNMAYVDLETTGLTAERGEIIEFGITVRDHENNVVKEFSKTYSPDPRIIDITGTGAEDVHGITVDEVRGRPMFTDPESQAEVWEYLQDTVLVAHNKSFEEGFFNVNLDGYQEAQIPTLDTVHISRYLTPDTGDNKLESFAEHHGVPYENSHRALPDAQMTADALHEWHKRLRAS